MTTVNHLLVIEDLEYITSGPGYTGPKNLVEHRSKTHIDTYYPATGPLRRDLYAKHLNFFTAGHDYQERLFMAANRCITPWTPVEMGGATRRCGELLGERGFDVRSWDGGSRCTRPASAVFLRSIEPAFRVHLDNGQFFDCSYRHRVLTTAGWISFARLVQLSDGLHCWHTAPDCRASCDTEHCRDGQQLLDAAGIDREELPSPDGAPGRTRSRRWPVDGEAPISAHSRACRGGVHHSIADDQDLLADLCDSFPDPASRLDALWPSATRRELRQFADEMRRLRALRPASSHQSFSVGPLGTRYLCGEESPEALAGSGAAAERFPFAGSRTLLDEGFAAGASGTAIFFPWRTPRLARGARIEYIVPLGLQPILDFTVSGTHCYESGGVIHHNCGKTEGCGAYETTLHLTGEYPEWWPGRRFDHATKGWAAGDTSKTVREIIQAKLLGPLNDIGTGMIPGAAIEHWTRKAGVAESVDTIYVRHKLGGVSMLALKSYDQRRISFQGTEQDFIWLDEEPDDEPIYDECLMRLMTTKGILFLTFTPLNGWTNIVERYANEQQRLDGRRSLTVATWDDAPHLDQATRDEMFRKLPPHQRDARSKGIPALGSGAVYPVEESSITCAPFPIPDHWPRCYGLDVGWNRTAAAWLAVDRENERVYVCGEHYYPHAEPSENARAIRARGEWIPGVIDPAARGRSQIDGQQILQNYLDLGLDVEPARNSVEAGIYLVWQLMVSGRFKVFNSCVEWLAEYRQYRREDGKIVKGRDHLMDATRYAVISGRDRAKVQPGPPRQHEQEYIDMAVEGTGWMA